jgi:hypothetical protein
VREAFSRRTETKSARTEIKPWILSGGFKDYLLAL